MTDASGGSWRKLFGAKTVFKHSQSMVVFMKKMKILQQQLVQSQEEYPSELGSRIIVQ